MKVRIAFELNLFFIALGFLTRIPLPSRVDFQPEFLNKSSRYFPLVGLLVGAVAGFAFIVANAFFPQLMAVLLSLSLTVWMTGAFHEDGFADFCDGFGGGWEKEQVLEIMKDSRLGTYGTVGLGLLLAIKVCALSLMAAEWVPFVLLLAHAWSRWLSISFIVQYQYVRDEDASKVKPLANQMSSKQCLYAGLLVLPLAVGLAPLQIASLAVLMLVFHQFFGAYLNKRIGGYTGDCLGAAQQLVEVLIYLLLLASW